jgi:hypothetical protein
MPERLHLAIEPVSRRPGFEADMQPGVSVSQSLDRPLDRHRIVLDIAHKPDFPGSATLRDRHGVLLLGDVESNKNFAILSHGPPCVHEARLGPPEQPSFLPARKGGPPAQPANMTSSAEYLSKDYSGWERRSAQWAVASKRPNFMLPVLVEDCEVPVAMAHIKRCALFGLGEDDARAHLEAYLIARTGRDKERADAEALSQALGGLPLAHEQAAAYCERLGVSLAEYARRLETTPAKLLDAERDAPAEYHDRLTVAKTFALAIDQAAKLHPAAEPLVVHSALLAPEPIPIFLFSEGRERLDESLATLLADDGLDEAIAALRAFALVDRDAIPDERDPAAATETIQLHRLVRKVASGRWQGEVSNAARRGLVEATAAIYPSNVFNNPSVAAGASARRAGD